MAKLLGIDIGTSGTKALLIDEHGTVLKTASCEYPILVPQPMWTEQNPADWWAGVQLCLREIGESRPDAIGLTGQMHGAVFLDENDQVIRPAILWNDQRTVNECGEIDRAVGADRVRQITCNPPLTGFQAPKILWLRNNEPENFSRLKSVLLPKDYIRFLLTGVKATEVSDASGTGLFDIASRDWSAEILSELDLSSSLFPDSFESDEVSARTLQSGLLEAGIPVVGGGGDQAAGAVGTGAVDEGIVSVSLGTSGVVFSSLPSAEYHKGGAAHTFCHANRSWHAMGVMLSCGGALRWYRDNLSRFSSYDEIAECATRAEAGCGGLTFLPYLTGERCPHNNPYARASFAGMTLAHSEIEIGRSVFEGVTFGLKEGFELIKGLGASSSELRVTGGGARSQFWVQMIADVFGTDCVTLRCDEGPAYGAAILAGVGIGLWSSTKAACSELIKPNVRFEPTGLDYTDAYNRYRMLYLAQLDWIESNKFR